MEKEIWKDVPEYEGIYQVSDYGNVKSLNRTIIRKCGVCFTYKGKRLIPKLSKSGYLETTLSDNGKLEYIRIHQIVAIAFLNHKRCGSELVVNHINFIKTDNRLINLEIVTTRENSNKKHLKSSSKYTGVYWHTKTKKWKSQIVVNNKKINLGLFKTEIEASNYYECALISIKNFEDIKIKHHKFKSIHTGVCWDKVRNKWIAKVKKDGKYKYVGIFKTEDEANIAILNYNTINLC